MYTCANGCRYSHGGWSSQEKKRMPQKNGSSLRTSIHPQIKHSYVSQLKERTSASKRYVATTQGEKNIFLLVLEFSNHLPRFRPCLYISWEALVFFSFCACMSPQYISNSLLTTAVYSWSGVYYWRPLLLGFMHSGRCGNTKHEQVAEGIDLLVPMQDLPPVTLYLSLVHCVCVAQISGRPFKVVSKKLEKTLVWL